MFAALRVRNEARWIQCVLDSIRPVCDEIFVLDDHSDDQTAQICRFAGATVHNSPFPDLDESRDKDYLLDCMISAVPQQDQHYLNGNPESPYWCLAIDGDEVLVADDAQVLKAQTGGPAHVYSLRILFLWDRPEQVRVDGVYGRFRRPSLFRLMNRGFRYQRTPWGKGANFHCSSIPQELLHHGTPSDARLLHLGYLHREDRLRKFAWYTQRDPDNEAEGRYLHIVQGDVPGVPSTDHLKWAGPLAFERLPEHITAPILS